MGFGYSYETIVVDSYKDLPSYNRPGKPNTRYQIYRNGRLHRDRFTDKDGKPTKDVDWEGTEDHGLGFPHDHYWSGRDRLSPVPHH